MDNVLVQLKYYSLCKDMTNDILIENSTMPVGIGRVQLRSYATIQS